MIRLQYTVLMRSELLQFVLEKLIILVCYSFLVEYENATDVIVMDLIASQLSSYKLARFHPYLVFEIFQH